MWRRIGVNSWTLDNRLNIRVYLRRWKGHGPESGDWCVWISDQILFLGHPEWPEQRAKNEVLEFLRVATEDFLISLDTGDNLDGPLILTVEQEIEAGK